MKEDTTEPTAAGRSSLINQTIVGSWRRLLSTMSLGGNNKQSTTTTTTTTTIPNESHSNNMITSPLTVQEDSVEHCSASDSLASSVSTFPTVSSSSSVGGIEGTIISSSSATLNNNNQQGGGSVDGVTTTGDHSAAVISNSQPFNVPSSSSEYHHFNNNVFKSSSYCNESVGYPLHDHYGPVNTNASSSVEGNIRKKPNAIMMRRRRSPKRKSNAMMDISDDEEQTSPPTNSTTVRNQPTTSHSPQGQRTNNMRTRLEPLFRPTNIGNHQPVQHQQLLSTSPNSQQPSTSPKSDEDTMMNDPSSYFSDTEMYVKKKDVLEYSKPIPAHFSGANTAATPFQKVFQKSTNFKPATPCPSPTNQTEFPSSHNFTSSGRRNNNDIPTAFHNLGLVGKLKEFCASIPSYSMTSPVIYSPLDLSASLDSLDAVYTCCGNNLLGQLGCGDKQKKTLAFQRKAKGSVKFIAGGNGFVLIATVNNELYSCGDNSYGQCGVGPITKKHCPNFMKSVWDKKLDIKKIACGYHHSMILTTCGKVYSCGAGCAGALGMFF